jgi:hypothetical protein
VQRGEGLALAKVDRVKHRRRVRVHSVREYT